MLEVPGGTCNEEGSTGQGAETRVPMMVIGMCLEFRV